MARELHDVPLAPRTTLQVGGAARRLVVVEDEADAVATLRALGAAGEPFAILGGGSNVVIADEGLGETVVSLAARGVTRRREGEMVEVDAAAGEPWDDLVADCVAAGLAGIECLSGIPGWVGATPIQNVGAYGQEVSEVIGTVRVFDTGRGEVERFAAADCAFGYRTSRFKTSDRGRYVVLGVTFRLREGPPAPPRYGELSRAAGVGATLASLRETVLALRRGKGMVVDPDDPDSRSAGSFFVNPVVDEAQADDVVRRAQAAGVLGEGEAMPRWPVPASGPGEPDRVKLAAGWLIERAGFAKGYVRGGVGLSGKHALAIVNRGGGSAAEVLGLARALRRGVHQAFGVTLHPEPVFLGFGALDW